MLLERNGHVAHIFVSENAGASIFHYTVQRVGSREILHWGQEHSMEDVQSAVDELLSQQGKADL
jgi:hypothetical protein